MVTERSVKQPLVAMTAALIYVSNELSTNLNTVGVNS